MSEPLCPREQSFSPDLTIATGSRRQAPSSPQLTENNKKWVETIDVNGLFTGSSALLVQGAHEEFTAAEVVRTGRGARVRADRQIRHDRTSGV
jgi:hypothetical protein